MEFSEKYFLYDTIWIFSPIFEIKSVRTVLKSLSSIKSLDKFSEVPNFSISLFSKIALVKTLAKFKKSSFLATKSVSHLILHNENEEDEESWLKKEITPSLVSLSCFFFVL
jgi:hypothetical protein